MNIRIIRYLPLILFVLPILSTCRSADRKQLAADYYELANTLFDLNDHERAAELYLRSIELDPALRSASYNLAFAYVEISAYDDAITVVKQMLKEDEENLLLLRTLGYCHYKNGDNRNAISAYEKALAILATDTNSLYNLSIIHTMDEDHEQALLRLEELIKIEEDNLDAWRLVGDAHYALEDHEQAQRDYERYLAGGRNNSDPTLNLISIYREQNRYVDALALLDETERARSHNSKEYFVRAELMLLYSGDFAQGMNALRRAINGGFADEERISALQQDIPSELIPQFDEIMAVQIAEEEVVESETETKVEEVETATDVEESAAATEP